MEEFRHRLSALEALAPNQNFDERAATKRKMDRLRLNFRALLHHQATAIDELAERRRLRLEPRPIPGARFFRRSHEEVMLVMNKH